MVRRTLVLVVASLLLVGLLASTAGAEPEREDIFIRAVLLSLETDRSFTTPNGKWVQERGLTAELAGTATIGTDDYTIHVTSEAQHVRLSPDGTDGLGWIKPTTTFTPVSGGSEFVCSGVVVAKRTPVPPPFPFGAEGSTQGKCDNGMKFTAEMLSQFELDPVSGAPIIVYYFTGETR